MRAQPIILQLLGLTLLLNVKSASAATSISGTLSSQTWTTNGSPYILTSDTTVPSGQTLIVQPGVRVEGRECQLLIQGNIIANGTRNSPITFTSENIITRWRGLRLFAATASSLSFCAFSYASESAAALQIESCSPSIDSCTFEENDTVGLYLLTSSSVVSRCIMRNNYNNFSSSGGAFAASGGAPRFYNTLICNNTSTYNPAGAARGSTLNFRNCTIAYNESLYRSSASWNWAFATLASADNSTFYNCVINGNYDWQGYGDFFMGPAQYSCLDYTTAQPAFKNPTTGYGRRALDDTLSGLPSDYSLQQTSPGVDQGNNTYATVLPTDLLGNARITNTNVDIGCYEYTPNYGTNLLATIAPAVRVSFNSESGKRYQVLYQERLNGATNWFTLGDILKGAGAQIGSFDTVRNSTNRFYRVSVVP